MVQLSHLCMNTGKTVALTIKTFTSKVTSLLFNILSRFVIVFLPRSKCLLISWLQSPSTVILEPKNRKSFSVFTFPPCICHGVTEPNAMILAFWMLSFKQTFHSPLLPSSRFSLFLLHFMPIEWYAYLRLFIFLPAILTPACDSCRLAFHIIYSAYKLIK